MGLIWLSFLRAAGRPLLDGSGRPLAVPGAAVPTAIDQPSAYGGGSAAAYAAHARLSLPPGAATRGRRLAILLAALAEEDARIDAAARRLLDEADPRTTSLLLEWETDFGLPDPCGGAAQTVAERRRALISRILDRPGGASRTYLIGYAAAYGYTIDITERRPMRVGFRAGERCYGIDWQWAFVVEAPATTITSVFRAGSRAGERLRTWGNDRLECLIGRAKPADTIAIFAYGGFE